MLCCIFNYPPKYRESIYKKIDEAFDTQFYFGSEVLQGLSSGIEKLDLGIFKNKPKHIKTIRLFRSFYWRTGIIFLPFKRNYTSFLITGDTPLSYYPFLFFCCLLGKKVYAWGHGLKHHSRRLGFLEKFYQNSLTTYLTYSEKGRERMIELGYPLEKYRVIYNSLNEGVDYEVANYQRSEIYKRHFDNDDPVLIFTGRLTENKRLDMLVQAVSELNEEHFNVNLMIVGDGTMSESLHSSVKNFGIEDRVWFYGECYDESVLKKLFYNADLCVSPGNVGLTALHALSYGVPVVTHDDFFAQMPEYEVVVPSRTGLLYKKGDQEDLKAKIREWFSLSIDRDKVREMCYSMINDKWNSLNQIEILKDVIKE